LVLGGVGETQLWGWGVVSNKARFFTLALPKKKPEGGSSPAPAPLVWEGAWFPVPDKADRVGDRSLLVYEALSGHPRYEVWNSGQLVSARAWDDGRTVYAVALGPTDGWVLAGRDASGQPWLEVSGHDVTPPEGWKGRLTVAAWVAADEKSPAAPLAAGAGAPSASTPNVLLWGPDGWVVAPEPAPGAGVFPLLGVPTKGVLALAGWQADAGTGALRPWFWDGQSGQVPGGVADGLPQAFGNGKGGAFLVVRHQAAPWFTREDGKQSVPLEGLSSDDRVVAVEAAPSAP